MPNLLATLVQMTDHAADALLVFRLYFWWKQTKAGVEIDGQRWLYGSYEHWATDTGLNVSQIKNAYIRLRSSGLIETRVFAHANGRVLHVRLLSRLIKLNTPEQEDLADGQPTTADGPPPMADGQPFVAVHIHEGTHGETHGGSHVASTDKSADQQEPAESEKVHEEEKMAKASLSAKALLASLSEPSEKAAPAAPAVLWCDLVSKASGQYVVLSVKDKAILVATLKKFKPFTPQQVVAFVVDKWTEIILKVGENEGKTGKSPPIWPSVRYLSAHAEAAIGLIHDNAKHPQTPPKAPKPVAPVPSDLQAIANSPEEDTPITSMAELEAIFSGKYEEDEDHG